MKETNQKNEKVNKKIENWVKTRTRKKNMEKKDHELEEFRKKRRKTSERKKRKKI